MATSLCHQLDGWIRLPHDLCQSVKVSNGCVTYVKLATRHGAIIGRPLPNRLASDDSISVSTKFCFPSEIHGDEGQIIKVYGSIPNLSKVVVSVEPRGRSVKELKPVLVQCPAAHGLVLTLDDLCVTVRKTFPENVDLGRIGPLTTIELFEDAAASVKIQGGLIASPQSSLDHAFNRLFELVCYPFLYKKQLTEFPLDLPKGVLLAGPPGVGKTYLVKRLTEAVDIPLVLVNGPDILSSTFGETEENLRNVFDDAASKAKSNSYGVSVLFIDEIDSIAPKRLDSANPTTVRIVTQLLTLLDGAKSDRGNVVVIAATNLPNAIDPALRRPGRFDREIMIEPPSMLERISLLKGMVKADSVVDLDQIAKATIGYVAADLAALYREAFIMAVQENEDDILLTTKHFLQSLRLVGPSISRDYRVQVEPDITLDSIGGYEDVKEKMHRVLIDSLNNPDKYRHYGISPPRGILLHGPPGCSKTTFAKALANTAGFSFYMISGAMAFSAFVGESERIVRDVFSMARMTSPSIIFIDEIDAIVGKRGVSGGDRDQVQERVLSTFLNEMDGIENAKSIVVLGATNRLHAIDSALLRPGRFDYLIEIPLPNANERASILEVLSSKIAHDPSIDFDSIAHKTDGWSGAELKGLLQEASMRALTLDLDRVTMDCINFAFRTKT